MSFIVFIWNWGNLETSVAIVNGNRYVVSVKKAQIVSAWAKEQMSLIPQDELSMCIHECRDTRPFDLV